MFSIVRIEVTSSCNLRCTFCPQSTLIDRKRELMSLELFSKIIERIAPTNRGVGVYFHITGEPTLNPELPQMVACVQKNGMTSYLTTNATKLTQEKSKQLIEAGLKKIEISFEGIDKETYERVRVRGKYEQVLENIEFFLKANNEAGHPVRTELVCVDHPSIPVEKIVKFLEEMRSKFDVINRNAYFDWLGKMDKEKIDKRHYVGCHVMDTDLNVLCNGKVVPCCMDVDGKMIIGDFASMSLEEILQSKEKKELKGRLACGNLKGLPCDSCSNPWGGRTLRTS